jgi:acyl carrier protein
MSSNETSDLQARRRVSEAVTKIIADKVGTLVDDVQEQHSLTDDLGCDSLTITEIVLEIEDAFGIEIPDEIAETSRTVGAIVDGIVRLLPRREKDQPVERKLVGSAPVE